MPLPQLRAEVDPALIRKSDVQQNNIVGVARLKQRFLSTGGADDFVQVVLAEIITDDAGDFFIVLYDQYTIHDDHLNSL